MVRMCTVCNHPERQEIDRRLARCDSIAVLSRHFAVSADSLSRHKENHLPKDLIASPSIDEITKADNLLSQIEGYKLEISEMKNQAVADGDIELALKAVDRALKCIELQSKVRGLIQEQPQVNILLNPEWVQLQNLIVVALRPYPEAMEAVRRALPSS